MKHLIVLLTVAAMATGITACSDDPAPAAGWAIVKVEILDGSTLTAICIDANCQEFDPADEVRTAEFSAFVDVGTEFEVRRVGDTDGGAIGSSPVGGCMLVRLTADAGEFVGGCGVPPPDV
jgi:hypothetical protein